MSLIDMNDVGCMKLWKAVLSRPTNCIGIQSSAIVWVVYLQFRTQH